jgi:hypothetical protein
MTLELTDEQTEALLRELNNLIDGDRYQFSARVRMLKAIRTKIRPEPIREPPLRKGLAISCRGSMSHCRSPFGGHAVHPLRRGTWSYVGAGDEFLAER